VNNADIKLMHTTLHQHKNYLCYQYKATKSFGEITTTLTTGFYHKNSQESLILARHFFKSCGKRLFLAQCPEHIMSGQWSVDTRNTYQVDCVWKIY